MKNNPIVLAATYNPASGTRMISFMIKVPTCLLAELRTHRIITQGSSYEHLEFDEFNMSANSARAIPINQYIKNILEDPFVPIWTGKQNGMNGTDVTEEQKKNATLSWISNLMKGGIINSMEDLIKLNIHKQNVNRLGAPFAYTTCILSGTEWSNFFDLRCPKYEYVIDNSIFYAKSKKELVSIIGTESIDFLTISNKSTAQPEFQVIAELLYDLYQEANWKESKYHIPFENEIKSYGLCEIIRFCEVTYPNIQITNESYYDFLMKISASMCAKLSYNTQNNEDTLEKHLERANMLIRHKHQEPFSHQATAMNEDEFNKFYKSSIVKIDGKKEVKNELGWCYNNRGFISQRYILENYGN